MSDESSAGKGCLIIFLAFMFLGMIIQTCEGPKTAGEQRQEQAERAIEEYKRQHGDPWK